MAETNIILIVTLVRNLDRNLRGGLLFWKSENGGTELQTD